MPAFDLFFTDTAIHVQTPASQFCIERTTEHLDAVALFVNQLLNGESPAKWPGQTTTERTFFRMAMARKGHYDWFNSNQISDVFNLMDRLERFEWVSQLSCDTQRRFFTTLFDMREHDEIPTSLVAV